MRGLHAQAALFHMVVKTILPYIDRVGPHLAATKSSGGVRPATPEQVARVFRVFGPYVS